MQKEHVRRLLHEAFSAVHSDAFEAQGLSHEDWVEIRQHLPLFVPEDLPWVLPRVLEDLLDTHTNDSIDTQGAEYVLMFLNNPIYVSEKTDKDMAGQFGDEAVRRMQEAREVSRQISKGDFDLFTQDQALAVYEWLQFARNWVDLANYEDDWQGALDFWKRKALD